MNSDLSDPNDDSVEPSKLTTEQLREFLERHYPELMRIARAHIGKSLKGKEEPEDLAQTACRRVIEDVENGRVEWQGEKQTLSYVLKVLRNKVIDKARYHRADRRDMGREQAITSPDVLFRPEESPSGVYRRKEQQSYLALSIDRLEEPTATIVRRYFLDEATLEEIAAEQEKSVGSIRHALKKGLEALQHRVSRGIV